LPPLLAKVINPATGKGMTLAGTPTLDSAARALNFSFSVPSFERAQLNLYRTRLNSVDAEFTAWSPRGEREFTNLADGEHRFPGRGARCLRTRSASPPGATHS
jgi:hypothetical protein